MPCCFSPGVYNPAGCPEQLILIRSASNVFPSRDRNMLLTSGVSSTSGGGDQCFLTIMGKKNLVCSGKVLCIGWVSHRRSRCVFQSAGPPQQEPPGPALQQQDRASLLPAQLLLKGKTQRRGKAGLFFPHFLFFVVFLSDTLSLVLVSLNLTLTLTAK